MKPSLIPTLLLVLFSFVATHAAPAIRVLVWDEQQPEQKKAYGDKFLGETIAAHLSTQGVFQVKSVSMSSPSQGWDDATLDTTDVLVMWCHQKEGAQDDERVEAVVRRVMAGKLGLIALHSAHWAKPFVRLMQERAKADAVAALPEAERATAKWEFVNDKPYYKGVKADAILTPRVQKNGDIYTLVLPQCVFPAWRADGAPGRMTTLLPDHPIARGLPVKWNVNQTEMYSEPFHVPPPDEVVFREDWDKGETFRSGCVWRVGKGTVFYFRPGHEMFPVYKQAEPLKVVDNAIRWIATGARR